MKQYISIPLFITALFFSSCTHIQNNKVVINEPLWLDDPYVKGSKTSVGCSKVHYKGIQAQKKLALWNAIDVIASQNNTRVENVVLRKKTYLNGQRIEYSQRISSLQSVEKVDVSVAIKAYHTKENGEICVWVIQD